MIQNATVGKSSRTPFKHWLYNAMLGQTIGAAATGRAFSARAVLIIDLCAGDGEDTYGECSSSPSIALKHTTSKLPGMGCFREAVLYEREALTFSRLAEKFGDKPTLRLIHGDSKGVTLKDHKIFPKGTVFVYADPNSVKTLPVTEELIASFTETTLFLMTLGCNVSGTKRLKMEDRRGWYDVVKFTLSKLKPWHDAHLISLERDSSQWAYFAAVPNAWSAERLAKSVKRGNVEWANGVSGASWRRDRMTFEDKLETLLLTQKELETKNHPVNKLYQMTLL